MDTTFLHLLNVSIASSWLVLAIIILRALLRSAPRWLICGLWGLLALRLLCPFSIESALSLVPSAEVFPEEILLMEGVVLFTPVETNLISNASLGEPVSMELSQGIGLFQINMMYASAIWAVGFVGLLAYAVLNYLMLAYKLRTATLYAEGVKQSEHIDSPFVMGFIRPTIYLPYGIAEADLEHVIAHERAHIRRGDHWWKTLGYVLLTAHWFNPLMWVAYALFCRDVESACDERVVRDLDLDGRREYASALLNCSVSQREWAINPLAFGEVSVKSRIKSVMNYRKAPFWVVVAAIVAALVLAMCLLTNPVSNAEESELASKPHGTSYIGDSNMMTAVAGLLPYPGGYEFVSYDLPFESDSCRFLANLEGGSGTTSSDFEECASLFFEEIETIDAISFRDITSNELLASFGRSDLDGRAATAYSLDAAVRAAVLARYASEGADAEGLIQVESHVLLANETAIGEPKLNEEYREKVETAYLLVLQENYAVGDDGELVLQSGSYIPTAITFDVDVMGRYEMAEYWEPRDGMYYADDVRAKFPGASAEDALNSQAYVELLEEKCYEQARECLERVS